MGTRRRHGEAGAVHHVMNRGVDRQRVFFADADRTEFGARLAEAHERFAVETLAYCLMANHYHLLVRSLDGRLSEAMHHIGTVYARHTNDRLGRDGPLFRGRFHSIRVDTDWYLECAVRYIHRNPLDLDGIADPADYRWSSFRTYDGLRPRPDFMSLDLVLGVFGDDRAELARFTRADMSAPAPRALRDLLTLIEYEIARDDLAHGTGDRSARWKARTVLLLVAERLPPVLSDSRPRSTSTSPRSPRAARRSGAPGHAPMIR